MRLGHRVKRFVWARRWLASVNSYNVACAAFRWFLLLRRGVGYFGRVRAEELVAWLSMRVRELILFARRVVGCSVSVRTGELDWSRASRCKNTPKTRADSGVCLADLNNARLSTYFSSRRTRLVTLFFAWIEQPARRRDAFDCELSSNVTINYIAG
jgi:hypothetical protein